MGPLYFRLFNNDNKFGGTMSEFVWMFFFDCAMLDWLLSIIVTPKNGRCSTDNTANFCMDWRLNYNVFRCNHSSSAVWKWRWICSFNTSLIDLLNIGFVFFFFCNVTMSRVPIDQLYLFFHFFFKVSFCCTLILVSILYPKECNGFNIL